MEDILSTVLKMEKPGVLRLISAPEHTREISCSVLPTARSLSLQNVCQSLVVYVEVHPKHLGSTKERTQCVEVLHWLTETDSSSLEPDHSENQLGWRITVEIGPRLNFKTSFCTNALSITAALGLKAVQRIEKSKVYHLVFERKLDEKETALVKNEVLMHFMDSVLECEYVVPLTSFGVDLPRKPPVEIPVMTEKRQALVAANQELSLGFDKEDLDYYTELFLTKIGRNPTNVECLDLAQSNSEHSRHWFFNGRLIIDGREIPLTLFRMVKDTQKYSNSNNVIKFSDNSSAINGFDVHVFRPKTPTCPAEFTVQEDKRHIIFTAETHNFPTAVEPFSGATTGTGGRIRDVQATGRGALVIAGTAGYSFGNCQIPGYEMPWEDPDFDYPKNFATPLKIIIEASNGASDYGNKFGEPVICGFARSFGARLPNGERREWVKPIMFTAGIGSIDHKWITKCPPAPEMKVVKIGGPVYRIGVGGGAASSTNVQGSNNATVDFNAVQRGDAEMEQKLNRVIRGCTELEDNPIVSIHDQGAGGNANVLKEIVEPSGAVIEADSFSLGDQTLSIHEVWVAEYQESVAVLVPTDKVAILQSIAERERCPVDVVGQITGTGKIVLKDFNSDSLETSIPAPVDLQLDLVLGNIPQKTFHLQRTDALTGHENQSGDSLFAKRRQLFTFREALHLVLQLPAVGSKRYLTNKVDRSVTGLIAQQQCVGPFHTPLADVAVIALSFFDLVGSATAIGEQPIKMLFDIKRGVRLSVVEALTNLMFAKISCLKDVKCSGNWMWPAKLPSEGAALYDACEAMCEVMKELGIAVDGGKDSLSMAAKCGDEIVKAPGTIVISAYAPCPDIRKKVTPDLKVPGGRGSLLWVDLSCGNRRLQGTSYAQALNLFDVLCEVPDLESAQDFINAFEVTQKLIDENALTAGHDISDGGLIVCLLEMAIAGNAVFDVHIPVSAEFETEPERILFSEEVGWVLEVSQENKSRVIKLFESVGICCVHVGSSYKIVEDVSGSYNGHPAYAPIIRLNDKIVYASKTPGISEIRGVWEEFSNQIEKLQADAACAESQRKMLMTGKEPAYNVDFVSGFAQNNIFGFLDPAVIKHRVAILREEGSNGDREMAAALHVVGFEVWDVNVQDLLDQKIDLDVFRGLVFVGGFSYADVFGSAKGWAAVLAHNQSTRTQLERFFQRKDTFSLGICNGCQLLTLLGIVGDADSETPGIDLLNAKAALKFNKSGRFESRFSTVKIQKSNAMMLQNMQNSQLGIWVAHGEGQFELRDGYEKLDAAKCISVVYVDGDSSATESYPSNPNGSPHGVAGICSLDGRHLAMMPHPERSVLMWQWPWVPETLNWPKDSLFSPWIKMFRNAYDWCGL